MFAPIASFILTRLYRYSKKLKPISATLSRAEIVPSWFLTNATAPNRLQDMMMFAKDASEHNPFCGFARLQFEIVNLSDDLVEIEDILIDKQKVERRYGTRIQVIPQGDFKSPLNLIAVVDSNSVDIYENYDKAIRSLQTSLNMATESH